VTTNNPGTWQRTLVVVFISQFLLQAQTTDSYKPTLGQRGKDVVWVPTPPLVIDTMLDLAKVTPDDIVMDLGSGDGAIVIAAAKRGARAIGIEYNADLVLLSRNTAAAEGLEQKATFVQADLFTVDLSQATVVTMFLLQGINVKLRPTLFELKAGTRIVSNTFDMGEWMPDERKVIEPARCANWCTALMWIVPAKVQGTWTTPRGLLRIRQSFQTITGTLGSSPITGKVTADRITFTADSVEYSGQVNGNLIRGATWSATRID
jgi:hypothetical protein